MTITTAAPSPLLVASPEGEEDLIQHHPARAFFELYSRKLPGAAARLDVLLKPGWKHRPVGLKSLLGCLIDYGAALVCPRSLGECDLAEIEADYKRPWNGEPLRLSVRVDYLCERCVVFSCELCLASDGAQVGYAQGTLSGQFGGSD